IIAEFSALGIVMDGEDVQKMPSVELDLIQQPRQIVVGPVVGTIGQEAPSVLTAILLIVAAIEVPAPAPLFRPYDLCVGIGRSNLDSIVQNARADLIHRGADRMYVAMRRMPDAVLVVENVVTRRQVRGRTQRLTIACTHCCCRLELFPALASLGSLFWT